MEKMPVGATIAHAYGFLIRRFFRILGLIWLPVAIYGAGAIALSPAFFARAARIAEFGPSLALWRDEVEILLFLVLGLFLFSVPAISLSRLALGLEKNRYLAHFNFGIREWRFFLASLRLMLILAAIVIAVGITAYAMAWALASFEIVPIPLDARGLPSLAAIRESPTLNLGIIAAELIAFAAMVYASIRFGFLLASLAAAEDRASLGRAATLRAGQ